MNHTWSEPFARQYGFPGYARTCLCGAVQTLKSQDGDWKYDSEYDDECPLKRPKSCSFCGKTEKQVDVLVQGPAVYICDECVKLCSEIVEQQRRKAAAAPTRKAP